jgi:diguanylate cyclase (GGDEF)-like protein
MKTKIISFIDLSELSAKLSEAKIVNEKDLLLQFFLADTNVKLIEEIQSFLQNNFNNVSVIGTTTDGIINNEKVLFGNHESLVVVTSFEHTNVETYLMYTKVEKHNNSYQLGQNLATTLMKSDTKLLILFSDGLYTNGEEFVSGVSSVSKDVVLAGGMAADNGLMKETYIFDMYEYTQKGAVGVALSGDRLNVSTNYTFDWEPIGKKLLVTKAVKNRVYEIDGMSAIDIYAKYMGQEVVEKLPKIGIEFPLILKRGGVSIGRAVIAKYEDGSLGFAGNIKEGEYVRFGVGSIEEILHNSRYQVEKLLDRTKYKPEAIFIYSCMARRRFLEENVADELKFLGKLGEMAGFFTYGEFFHTTQENQLLNETMTVLLLSENEEPLENSLDDFRPNQPEVANKIRSSHVVARLANTVSNELEELNDNLEKRIQENVEFIYKQAYYDKLTGLPNRIKLINNMDISLGKVLFLINIDDFTTINDFYGYEIGDKVLKKLANILQKLTEDFSGDIYKLPSDEFVLVLNVAHKRDNIENIMKEIINFTSEEKFIIDANLMHVSVTISAAYVNKEHTALANADMTLKMARRSNKQYMIFDKDLQLTSQYEKSIKIVNSIKSAIEESRIIPYYQAIFSVKTGKVEKYEALVRLIKEDGTVLSPVAFLGVSEKIKLYPKITEIMIEKTFSSFSKNGFNFSINLAFSDILNEKTREYLFQKIVEYNIASQLTIEILETQEYEKDETIFNFILDVYKYGAKIAIDDFGSGFANFKYMTTIKSDYMKIDGSLIRDIVENQDDRLIVETIIVFAKKLGKKTIAEFVHSKEVYDIVKEMGVDFMQGYYLAEPSPVVCQ